MAALATQSASRCTKDRQQAGLKILVQEMMAEEFDSIRFAAYRTASKLRFIQKRTRFILFDLYNIVDAFCQCALNTVEHDAQLNADQLLQILSRFYIHIDKRLAPEHRFNWQESVDLLLGWLLHTYDPASQSTITALALKVSLSTLSSGKLIDKIRYHYTLVSDSAGKLVPDKLERFLHDLLALAVGLFEGPNFSYDSTTSKFILGTNSGCLTIDAFAKAMLDEPGPQCLLWLTIFQRLAYVEMVAHGVRCAVCAVEPLRGFRYQCQQCVDYNLCQQCFWNGSTSGQHSNQHEMREFTAWNQAHSSMPKSFQVCANASNGACESVPSNCSTLGQQQAGPTLLKTCVSKNHALPQRTVTSGAAGQTAPPHSTMSQNSYHSLPSTHSLYTSTMNSNTIQKSSSSISAEGNGGTHVGFPYNSSNENQSVSQHMKTSVLIDNNKSVPSYFAERKTGFDREQSTAVTSGLSYCGNQEQQSRNLIQQYNTTSADEADNLINHHGSRSAAIRYQQKQVREHREKINKLELKNKEIMADIERLKNCVSEGAANNGFMHELRALRQRKMELDDRMLNLQESRGKLTGQLDVLTRLITPSRATPEITQFVKTNTKLVNPPDIRQLLQAANCVTTAMGSLVNELGQEVVFSNDHSQASSLPAYATQNRESYGNYASSPHGHALLYRQADSTYDWQQDHPKYTNQLGNSVNPAIFGASVKELSTDERSFYSYNDLDKGTQIPYSGSLRYNRQDIYGTGQSQRRHRSNLINHSGYSDTMVDQPRDRRDYYHAYSDPENDPPLHSTSTRRGRQDGYGSVQSQHHHRSNSLSQSGYSDAMTDQPRDGRDYYHAYSDPENDPPLHLSSTRRGRQDGYGSGQTQQHHRSNSLNQSGYSDAIIDQPRDGRDYYHPYSDPDNDPPQHSTSTRRGYRSGQSQHHLENNVHTQSVYDSSAMTDTMVEHFEKDEDDSYRGYHARGEESGLQHSYSRTYQESRPGK